MLRASDPSLYLVPIVFYLMDAIRGNNRTRTPIEEDQIANVLDRRFCLICLYSQLFVNFAVTNVKEFI